MHLQIINPAQWLEKKTRPPTWSLAWTLLVRLQWREAGPMHLPVSWAQDQRRVLHGRPRGRESGDLAPQRFHQPLHGRGGCSVACRRKVFTSLKTSSPAMPHPLRVREGGVPRSFFNWRKRDRQRTCDTLAVHRYLRECTCAESATGPAGAWLPGRLWRCTGWRSREGRKASFQPRLFYILWVFY